MPVTATWYCVQAGGSRSHWLPAKVALNVPSKVLPGSEKVPLREYVSAHSPGHVHVAANDPSAAESPVIMQHWFIAGVIVSDDPVSTNASCENETVTIPQAQE